MRLWSWREIFYNSGWLTALNFDPPLNAMNLVEMPRLTNEWIIYCLNSVLKLSFRALEELEEFEQLKQLLREMCRAKSKVKKTRAREIFFCLCWTAGGKYGNCCASLDFIFGAGEWELSGIANFGVKWEWADSHLKNPATKCKLFSSRNNKNANKLSYWANFSFGTILLSHGCFKKIVKVGKLNCKALGTKQKCLLVANFHNCETFHIFADTTLEKFCVLYRFSQFLYSCEFFCDDNKRWFMAGKITIFYIIFHWR